MLKNGRLAFIRKTDKRSSDKHVISLFKCDCGKEVEIIHSRVKNGYTKSCGCLVEEASKNNSTHGMRYTKEWATWKGIKERCRNKNSKDYKRYGGKGIDVCDEWYNSFDAFYAHIGDAPSPKHSIDRIDNTKGYFPQNVRWATIRVQAANTSMAHIYFINGQRYESMGDAMCAFGVSDMTIRRWCLGGTDNRTNRSFGPKDNCWREKRYANNV